MRDKLLSSAARTPKTATYVYEDWPTLKWLQHNLTSPADQQPIYYCLVVFPHPSLQLVQSLGVAIYRALDWGLDDSEERELSPQLEHLIERMAEGNQGGEGNRTTGNGATDEGYSGQEEEEEEEEEPEGVKRPVCTFRQVMALCASRLANQSLAPEHYQAVCRALFVETLELQTFLIKIRDAKEVR